MTEGNVYDMNKYRVPAVNPVQEWINEMRQLASQGDLLAQEAIASANAMFPDEEPITY